MTFVIFRLTWYIRQKSRYFFDAISSLHSLVQSCISSLIHRGLFRVKIKFLLRIFKKNDKKFVKNLIKKIFPSFVAHCHKQNDCPRTFLSLMCKIHVLFCTSLPKKLKAAASSMYLSRSVAGVLRYVYGIWL